MTYDAILFDMLNQVTDGIDKREGSIIYDALAPCAYKLAETYFQLSNFMDLVSGDTAVEAYLDRVVSDYGIKRKAATYAKRKVETSASIEIGSRWGLNDTTYIIVEKISELVYSAQCEQLGSPGNLYTGVLENIDNINTVNAMLTDVLISGEDEETDENLRFRYYSKIRMPSTSGNCNDYKQWALEVTGVGDAEIVPLWNGAGSVKVVIVDNDKKPTSQLLIEETAAYIEEKRPIGASVTVTSATAKEIDIKAKICLAAGYHLAEVLTSFQKDMTEYFKSIAFSLTYVSFAKVGTILLNTDGVVDYNNLKVNGSNGNVALQGEEIPMIGNIGLEV